MRSPCDLAAKIYPAWVLLHVVAHGEGRRSILWDRLTWSRALFAVLVLNLVWTASLFVCPFTVAPGSFVHQVGGANLVDHENIWETFPLYARVVYTIGDAQCHQLWYRSFLLNGNQMPIDQRMSSMYLFANVGLVAAIFARPSTSTGQVMLNALPEFLRRRLGTVGPDRAGGFILAIGLIPMAIDGFHQLSGRYESTPLARGLTGGLAGFVGGLLVGAMLVTIRQFSLEMQRMYAHSEADSASLR